MHWPPALCCCSSLSGSLCGRLPGSGQWTPGGEGEHLSPWPPTLGLQLWGASPAETLPWATAVPLSLGRLTIAAVSELAVFSNLQFGGVGGGDAVTGLHAVPLFQLCQSTHEAGVGGIQGGDALLLWARRASVGYRVGSWAAGTVMPPGPPGL